VLWALALAALGSCTNLPVATEDAKTPDVFDRIRALDILPRSPQPVENGPNNAQRAKPMIYTGSLPPSDATGAVASMSSGAGSGIGGGAGGGEGYELNFENTPITQVAKAVLGDIMGVGYSIDPRVQGSISLSSGKPVPKTDLLFVLENALRMSNVVLIRDTSGYRIVPMGDAVGGGNTDAVAGRAEPGYGVSVLPLHYISGGALIKLLDSFATRPGMVRADPGRNLLLIQGTGPERRATMETALSFDVDWMRGQSVGIFPVQYSNPEPIIAELEKIMDSGEGGMSQGNIKFQPMARMNGVLVVTKKAGPAARRGDVDQAARHHRHQPHRRARLSRQLQRGEAGRQGAQRHLRRRRRELVRHAGADRAEIGRRTPLVVGKQQRRTVGLRQQLEWRLEQRLELRQQLGQ
jgi:general secretion pathway protein D